ncbi:hypothetical protein SAMN05444410_10412 [Hydrobacter penzbergensis]|uniref:BZIP transcription factor n=1 Tax=Hydrobacter penzbergensis TaxID=1235997 RepID=A0A8X8IEY4_9BACT|nr:hypothetical protein [Hydrobacter penzbergensis]SDW58196.1 hypothetical protein SAMN05444410_10412 [Hydrobacter penzbergensis]
MKKYLLGAYCFFQCVLTFAQNTFPSSGNVGIGTLSPVSQLTINGGDLQIESGQGRFKGWYHTGTGLGTEIGVSGGNGYILTYDRTGQAYASTSIQSNNALFTVSNNNSFLFAGGNVGFGTTAPAYPVHQQVSFLDGYAHVIENTSANSVRWKIMNAASQGAFEVAVNGNGNTIIQTGKTTSSPVLSILSGNVGIGTLTPASQLTIGSGDLQVESGQGRFKGWYHTGTGLGTELGVWNGNGYILTYDRTGQVYASTIIQSNNALFTVSSNNSFLFSGGNVGIGTTVPTEMLSVKGNVKAQKMIVTQTGWSDYVFAKDYKLRSLNSLETFIKENKHLPEVPSAKEVGEKGISVGDNQALLLKKIEELTLYVIEIKKEVLVLQHQNKILKDQLNKSK